jgi:hypothetical protein
MPFAKLLKNERMQLKSRPECRQFIVKEQLIPDIVRVGNDHYWDGRSCRDARSGERKVFTPEMPNGTRQELRRLARIGFFGNLDFTILDWFKYMRLREAVDGKRQGVFQHAALWEPRSRNRGTRRTLKRKK